MSVPTSRRSITNIGRFATGAALIDVSPLMKYLIEGPDAARLLHKVTTRDILKMAVGQVYYTGWCDEDGKLLDDGTVVASCRATLPHDIRRAVAALAVDECRRHGRARSAKSPSRWRRLSLQGPKSRAVLNRCCAEPLDRLKYFRLMHTSIGNIPVSISRTGYTGDLGYEIWMEAEHALPVWDALMEAGDDYGITPVRHPRDGHGARGGRSLHDRCRLHAIEPRLDRRAEIDAASNWDWIGPSTSTRRATSSAAARSNARSATALRGSLTGLEIEWDGLGDGCSPMSACRRKSRPWPCAQACR